MTRLQETMTCGQGNRQSKWNGLPVVQFQFSKIPLRQIYYPVWDENSDVCFPNTKDWKSEIETISREVDPNQM